MIVQPFNLRLARYRSRVQKVAVHGDGGAAWRMQAPSVSGPTSPLVNPNVSNWAKDKPTPSGSTNLDDERSKYDNPQGWKDDNDRMNTINDVEAPPEKLFKVRLKDGYQLTPELAKEVGDWKNDGGSMYVIVDSPEKVEEIRRRVPGVMVEERGE